MTDLPPAVATCIHCHQPLDFEGTADDGTNQCAKNEGGPVDDLGNVPHEPEESR